MSLFVKRTETHLVKVAMGALALVVAAALPAGQAAAHATVVYDEAGDDAPRIGLIGDSSLAGLRWSGNYSDLRDFNFLLNAESCRRTLERSCWSREGYRPDNAVVTMQQLAGQWGELLVVMSGYNDTHYLFDDAVDAVVDEARRQGVGQVVWLTLRTSDVDYQEPMRQADGDTYAEANRMLFDAAEAHGDYLQVADWATYSADRSDWVYADGVHLTGDGATALSTFIAAQVHRVLEGSDITPEHLPWTPLGIGANGELVTDVQRALIDSGHDDVGEADGDYGMLTATAVQRFQAERGLTETGVVDAETATELGVYALPASFDQIGQPAADTADDATAGADGPAGPGTFGLMADRASAGREPVAEPVEEPAGAHAASTAAQGSWLDGPPVVPIGLAAIVVLAVVARRAILRQQRSDETPVAEEPPADGATPELVVADDTTQISRAHELDDELQRVLGASEIYDYEQESASRVGLKPSDR